MTGVRGFLAALGAASVLVVMACGARSSLLDEIPGAAPPPVHVDAATPIPDAHVRDVTVHDAHVDGRTVDAMRDSAQRKDAEDAHDAAHDAIDAGHPDACDYTGKPRGTVDTIASAGDGGILDFDLDCTGVVFTTAQGAVLSCPISGCIDSATVVAPQGAFNTVGFQVRIAPKDLYVTSGVDSGRYIPFDGAPNDLLLDPSAALFTLPRGGGQRSLVLRLDTIRTFPPSAVTVQVTCSAVSFGTTGTTAYFGEACVTAGMHGGGGGYRDWYWGPFRVVRPLSDGGSDGAVAATSFPEWSPDAPPVFNVLPEQQVSGTTYCTHADAGGVECFDLNGSPDAGVTYAPDGFVDIVTDAFVLWHDSTSNTLACAAGPTCATPATLPDAGRFTPIFGLHDTLFLLGGTNTDQTLATCEAPALLAGNCAPSVFATGLTNLLLAGPVRLVATETNLYVLSAGRVLRIAR